MYIILLITGKNWKQYKCPPTSEQIEEPGSFVEMWMDLESVTQSEVGKRKTNIIF